MGVLAVSSLLLSGCSLADWPRFGWPSGVTNEAKRMQEFWSGTFMAALVIGVLVWGLMFWSFTFHRKRKGGALYPKQTKENLPLELVYTGIPLLMVTVLFYFTVTTENYVLKMDPNPAVTVNVTAFKWNWDFSYEGSTSPDVVGDRVHTLGSSSEIPVLVLPVNRIIQYNLSSKDVIHSFWVPQFLFKRDVFPYPQQNQVDNGDRFQNTITQTGAMVGRCAELCGTYHSMMEFELRVLPADLFDQYLALREQKNPATNVGYTTGEALTKLNCGELCSPAAITTHPFDTRRQADSLTVAGGK